MATKKKTSIKKIVADFVQKSANDEFWQKYFEIEQLSEMKLHDDEAFVIVMRNPQTGEEKRYEGVHLKSSLGKVKN